MILKKLEDLGVDDLNALVTNGVTEGRTIDYKRDLPGNTDSDKKEFLADVSSFANTSGGDLLVGVDEHQGVPIGLPGLTVADFDQEVRRLDSIINDGLEPRIRFCIRTIRRDSAPSVLIIRVDRSWLGPHRVVFKGHDKFYARNSAGKYAMDVSELRSAFTLSGTVAERVRQFRTDRIARIQSNQTPVLFRAAMSKTILHLIPFESFAGAVEYDVLQLSDRLTHIQPLIPGEGWSSRINLDGFAVFNGTSENSSSYTQVFRNGSIEAVESHWLNGPASERMIPFAALEGGILRYLVKAFEIQKQFGVKPPIAISLSLVGTKGLKMALDSWWHDPGFAITEENLFLPETVVPDFNQSPGRILKPIFDLLWNACGFAETRTLDQEGNWVWGKK